VSTSWFRTIWDALSEEERSRIRDKAEWEHLSLMHVLIEWPTLVPEVLRDSIPTPAEANP
jgi:hypothetical protein